MPTEISWKNKQFIFYNNRLGEFIEKINTRLYEDDKVDLNFEFE